MFVCYTRRLADEKIYWFLNGNYLLSRNKKLFLNDFYRSSFASKDLENLYFKESFLQGFACIRFGFIINVSNRTERNHHCVVCISKRIFEQTQRAKTKKCPTISIWVVAFNFKVVRGNSHFRFRLLYELSRRKVSS